MMTDTTVFSCVQFIDNYVTVLGITEAKLLLNMLTQIV